MMKEKQEQISKTNQELLGQGGLGSQIELSQRIIERNRKDKGKF